MFEGRENPDDLIIIFCHRFDDATGLYAHSAPVGACREETIVPVLEALYADMRHPNHLLETAAFGELPADERRELADRLLGPYLEGPPSIYNARGWNHDLPANG